MLVTFKAGRKTWSKNQVVDLDLRFRRDFGFVDEAYLKRLGLDARGIEAAAVVRDLDHNVTALPRSGQPYGASSRLARGASLVRILNAVVGAVAHQMGERIFDQIEDLTIKLGIGSDHLQSDVFAEINREVTHDARQFLPRIADRLHARLHYFLLDLARDAGQALQWHVEFGIVVSAENFEQLIARENELRDHGHELVERVDAHPDRLARNTRSPVARFSEVAQSRHVGSSFGSDDIGSPL
jgi:hypothetical protein